MTSRPNKPRPSQATATTTTTATTTASAPDLAANMEYNTSRGHDRRARRRKKSFTEALKEKYCVEDDPAFDFIVVSPKRKTNSSAELAHLQTVVLNDMDITRADIPRQGLVSICPNVVDLDLANNLLETWSELLSILSQLPKVRYLNVSRNKLRLDLTDVSDSLLSTELSVESLALNDTGTSIEEVVRLSKIMPALKELQICDNNYENLSTIEDSISDGAFSCLECLRLNNNELSSWAEVWKLRRLPHLKFLVLSGNPIDNVFYSFEDGTNNNNTNVADLHKQVQDFSKAEISQKSSSLRSDKDAAEMTEACLHRDLVDVNTDDECEGILIDSFDPADDKIAKEPSDSDEDGVAGRIISRSGYHTESELSSGSSSSDPDQACEPENDDTVLSNPKAKISMCQNMHTGNAGSNNNNSCRGSTQKCLCDEYSGFDGEFLVNDDVFDNENLENGSNETDDWHRAAAEEFLHEIIDSINFDDISDQLVPDYRSSDATKTCVTGFNVKDTSMSLLEDSVASCVNNLTLRQSASKERVLDVSRNNAPTLMTQVCEFHLGPSYLSSDIDADFIPRAIRLLDDEDMNSFFYMAAPSPPKSRAQRCLFQQPVSSSSSSSNDLEDASYRESSHHSGSDLCSDCEAEQPPCEKQTEGFFAVGVNIAASTEVKLHMARESPSHSRQDLSCQALLLQNVAPESYEVRAVKDDFLSRPIKDCSQFKPHMSNHKICKSEQKMCSDKNSNATENVGHEHHNYCCVGGGSRLVPFQHLQVLCLSSANLQHWSHLKAFTSFPKLTNLRLKNNPLYSSVSPDDRRKLYIASLPKVTVLNGSEVSLTEREKAERHYLRYFMDKEDKPDFYHTLVKKHGPPVKLVDIDLGAGYQEWANIKFVCKGVEEFSRKIHLVEPVGKLRTLISQTMGLPKRCFIMYHYSCGPSHPESERELVELRCESIPMSRFDFAEGDEIHIDFQE